MRKLEVKSCSLDQPIHTWFGLTYAQYLTIPRSVLQSMPHDWQETFVKCLEQLDESFNWRPLSGRYWVTLKDSKGRFQKDPLANYRHVWLDEQESGKKKRGS